MNELLTDDEIVALVGASGRLWPCPLPTVMTDERAVTAAAFRGLRSLITRGFAVPTGSGKADILPEFTSTIARVSTAPEMVIAHVSGVEEVGVAGAFIAAFIDDGGIVLDVVNATGIHGLRISESISAAEAICGFTRGRYAPTDADTDVSPLGCVIIASSQSETVYRVQPAQVEVGRVHTDGATRFIPDSSASFADIESFVARALY